MQSHIALQLASAIVEPISLNRMPHFCSWPIQYALTNLITLPEGQILKQFFSSYLAYIDFYEYMLDHDTFIPYTCTTPAICMLMMFDGYSALYDSPENLISENPRGAYHMGFINKGNYTAKIKAGKTKLVLLTIRTEWFMHKTERLEQLKPIVAHFSAAEQPNFYLPDCPITQEVSNLTKKMLLHDGVNHEDLDITVDSVLNQLVSQYHRMVEQGNFTTNVLHLKQAGAIANYVKAHYMEKTVDNIPKLAGMFYMSERQLLRLAKIAFQMPLHQYVISLRMNKAIVKLISSNKPIHEIAAEVGYPNAHYFSTAFKKFHHIKPEEVHGLCL